ncbi:MAG: hypothetical protein KJO11_12445 [Gemmatimonadetes bacterium]|nr:hypothetical protein [Gemmatimonadota bacterium]NNK62061.1 hypothetical protein [Gemmatimonadota bacterium]
MDIHHLDMPVPVGHLSGNWKISALRVASLARVGARHVGRLFAATLLCLAAAEPGHAQFVDPDHVVVARIPSASAPLVVATNPDPSTRTRITLTCRTRTEGLDVSGGPRYTEVWARQADGSGRRLLGRCPPDRPARHFIAMENVSEIWILDSATGEESTVAEYELGCVTGRSLPRPVGPTSGRDWIALCAGSAQRRGTPSMYPASP